MVLHLALSADGFIAKSDGNSDWVSSVDADLFLSRAREAGCVAVGRITFDQYKGQLFPIEGVANIVLTSHQQVETGTTFFAMSPEEAVIKAEKHSCSNILIAGGGMTGAAFLKAGLIDEVFFTVHPIVLGQGIRPFDGFGAEQKLKLAGTRELGDGLVELHYMVEK